MVFSLLLLASIIQGLRGVQLYHYEKLEAVVGQSISLPCIVISPTDAKIVSIEWSKKTHETTKLVLYSSVHGTHQFWENVTIHFEHNSTNTVRGSYLQLPEVKKWDEGNYSCDIAAFPYGSLRTATQLVIKDDIKITCDVNGTVEAHKGENVTIRCRSLPNANAKYKWTKNNKLLSEHESLELWLVTDADAGVYTLTVNTGNKRLHKEFVVTVLTATTSLKTVSPQGLTESAGISLTTSPTPELSDHTDWTTIVATTIPNTTNVTITTVDHVNSFTNSTHINVTSSPATQSYTQDLVNSTASSTVRLSTVLNSTQETDSNGMKNESKLHTQQPEGTFSMTPEESSTPGSISKNPRGIPTGGAKDTVPIHLLLVLIIVPMLVLIAVAGVLFRRQVIKSRMDLPPPFKPPPPPVKYTAVRHSETLTETFPISRCNSLIETQI